MFLPYIINIETVNGLPNSNYEEEYNKLSEVVLKQRTREELRKVLIDGSKLQEEWFPTNNLNFNVFLSHSHGDETEAKNLAAYLKSQYDLTTFIDSCYWNYCDVLLEQLDNQLWEVEDGNNLYNYKKRNYSTTIIHTMLSTSLMKMMSKCECYLLMDSSNVHVGDNYEKRTRSAWIYQEAEMSKNLERNVPIRWRKSLVENMGGGILRTRYFCTDSVANESQSVTFNLDTSKMHLVDSGLLKKMLGYKKEKALDVLHKEYIERQYNDNILFESAQRRIIR